MEIVVFKITGWEHGLLMSNPASMLAPTETGLTAKDKKALTQQEEADRAAYKDEDGFLRFPSMAFRSCMIRAATGRTFSDGKKKKAIGPVVKGGVFPAEEWVAILDKQFKPTKKYAVHSCRGVNRTTQGAIMINRAWVRPWTAKVPLEIDTSIVGVQEILDLLNQGGKAVGIGAFRPFCPVGVGGPYGRFSASL